MMEGRGDSTATGTTVPVAPDISIIGESSFSGISNHQHQSCETTFSRGSTSAVRRIPDRFFVVPCSATMVSEAKEPSMDVDLFEKSEIVPCSAGLVSVSKETETENVDACEESEIIVDIPVVVPSDALVSISEETITEDVDVCEESENVVDISDAFSSAELVPVFEETSMDVDVCEKSEIEVDVSVVTDFDSLQTNPGKDDVPSEPIKSL